MWILYTIIFLLGVNNSFGHVIHKRQAQASPPKRIVCYYANWSVYRPGNSSFSPENINPHLCTHVIYAFATLEREVGLVPFDPKQDLQLDGYKKFIDLKKLNRDLKLMLGVGGTKEGSIRFSKIAGDPELRNLFVVNGVLFLRQFEFDGLDLVWQYPGFREGSTAADKENYVQLVKELKEAFRKESVESKKPELILSMAVPSLITLLDRGFDLEELNKYMSFMSVLTYDFHTSIEPFVNHVAPLYPLPGDDLNIEFNADTSIRGYLRKGADPQKLNLGIPLYGTSYKLADPDMTDIGSPTEDEGEEVSEPGVLTYNQLCQRIQEGDWTVKHVNRTAMGPYAYKGTRWMSYDDAESVRNKAKYALEKKLGGLMFWSIDQDDFHGLCGDEPFPLVKAGLEAFLATSPDKAATPPPARERVEAVPEVVPAPPALPPLPAPPAPSQQRRNPSPPPPPPPNGDTQTNLVIPTVDKDDGNDPFPFLNGAQTIKSERDIIFQTIRLWVNNYFN